jgi:phage replication-related protein YjqB (UPF0714/DUF867 family)
MLGWLGLREYRGFQELARYQRAGRDWERTVASRGSAVAIVAPHGGNIEAGTSEIAALLAGDDFSLYAFEGRMPRGNSRLHITSTRFDDPVCLALVAGARIALTVHGCRGEQPIVYLGGRHTALRARMAEALRGAGFNARPDDPRHPGEDPRNICNRGNDGHGVQLEISCGLRRTMFAGLRAHERAEIGPPLVAFVVALHPILAALERELAGPETPPV